MFHDAFNPNTAEVDDLKSRYREGKVGDVEVKKKLAAAMNTLHGSHQGAPGRIAGKAGDAP